jgi:hypothetical protein
MNKLYEARVEAQLAPIQTGLGELRGAVDTQWYDRRLSAAGEDGIFTHPKPYRVHIRGTADCQEIAFSGRRPH